ncbi:hypothetical protein NO263_07615 [Gluconacetobacter entanii]|uniref:Uncharacterized protein n=2 Tax=Gluconacetobacter entanii TaxID=108528 RepID=A0ABT3K4V4_9PROT|nr:hypothetical protein [Gluconacetobacter entanii]MCW4590444.1 hypothetical protein [Gluconacetobacter entanii]MCW4592646.1 hypothetical protein [Gluconacetobacter entanii]
MLSAMRGFCARKAPPRLIRDHIDPAPLMLGNDVLGDCTSAALGNHARATAALGGFQVDVTTAQAEAFYSLSTGYVPGDPRTDNGGVEVDVLTTAMRDGYAVTNQTLFPIWGSADPGDLNGLRNIMAGMSAGYIAVQFADADLWEDENGNLAPVLDTDIPASRGDPNPNPKNGHAPLIWGYAGTDDTDICDLITWGTLQKVTWRWIKSRIMEVHAIAWRQLMPATGLAPTGQDWEALVAANDAYLRGAA